MRAPCCTFCALPPSSLFVTCVRSRKWLGGRGGKKFKAKKGGGFTTASLLQAPSHSQAQFLVCLTFLMNSIFSTLGDGINMRRNIGLSAGGGGGRSVGEAGGLRNDIIAILDPITPSSTAAAARPKKYARPAVVGWNSGFPTQTSISFRGPVSCKNGCAFLMG